jgi:hypothetical protein
MARKLASIPLRAARVKSWSTNRGLAHLGDDCRERDHDEAHEEEGDDGGEHALRAFVEGDETFFKGAQARLDPRLTLHLARTPLLHLSPRVRVV